MSPGWAMASARSNDAHGDPLRVQVESLPEGERKTWDPAAGAGCCGAGGCGGLLRRGLLRRGLLRRGGLRRVCGGGRRCRARGAGSGSIAVRRVRGDPGAVRGSRSGGWLGGYLVRRDRVSSGWFGGYLVRGRLIRRARVSGGWLGGYLVRRARVSRVRIGGSLVRRDRVSGVRVGGSVRAGWIHSCAGASSVSGGCGGSGSSYPNARSGASARGARMSAEPSRSVLRTSEIADQVPPKSGAPRLRRATCRVRALPSSPSLRGRALPPLGVRVAPIGRGGLTATGLTAAARAAVRAL